MAEKALRVPKGVTLIDPPARAPARPVSARPLGERVRPNLDLNRRPQVQTDDGIATVRTMGVGTDRGEVNIPTIADDGSELDPQGAVDQFRKSGQHLGVYDTPEDAERMAQHFHEVQAEQYGIEPPVAEMYPSAKPAMAKPVRVPKGVTLIDNPIAPKPKAPATAGQAFGRGIDKMQGLLYRAAEATGEATGSEGLTEFGRAGAERNQAEAAAYPQNSKFSDIRGVSDFGQWAKETAAEQAPMMAPSVAGALGGGALGAAVGGPFAPITATIGAAIGAFVPSAVMGTGEVQAAIKEKDPNAVAPGMAFAGGTAIGTLDTIIPGRIGAKLVARFGLDVAEQVATRALMKPVKEAAKQAPIEGVTEAVQEAIGEITAASATNQPVSPDLPGQMLEAGAAGALFGGGTGAVTGGVDAAFPGRPAPVVEDAPPPDDGLPPQLPAPGPDNRPPPVPFNEDLAPGQFDAAAQAAKDRAAQRATNTAAGYRPEPAPVRGPAGAPVTGIDGEPVMAPVRDPQAPPPVMYGKPDEAPRVSDDLSPSTNELVSRTGTDPGVLVFQQLGVPTETFAGMPGEAKERLVAAAQRQESATRPAAPLVSADEAGRAADVPAQDGASRPLAEGLSNPGAPPQPARAMQGKDQPTGMDVEGAPPAAARQESGRVAQPQAPYAKTSAGGSERPFRAQSSAAPEHDAFFEERARTKTAADRQAQVDELMRKWASEAQAREEASRAREKTGRRDDADAAEQYAKSTFSKKHAKPDKDGRFQVDQHGYVLSDKGTPIQFPDHQSAARWIVDHGQNSPDQIFDRANHPVGKKKTGRGATTGTITIKMTGKKEGPGGGAGGPASPKGPPRTPPGVTLIAPPSRDNLFGAKKAEAAPAPEAEKIERPQNLMEYMASVGVREDAPDLADLGNANALKAWHKRNKFKRKIVRADGKARSVAELTRMAEEAGFFGPDVTADSDTPYTTENAGKLDRVLENHLKGSDTYRDADAEQGARFEENQRFQLENRDQMERMAATYGIDPSGLQDNDLAQKLSEAESVKRGTDGPDTIVTETDDEIERLIREVESGEWSAGANSSAADGDDVPFETTPAPKQAAPVSAVGQGKAEAAGGAGSDGANDGRTDRDQPADRKGAGRGARSSDRGAAPSPKGGDTQLNISGAEPSARQAAQAREEKGRGKIVPKAPQKEADDGLFRPAPDDRQSDLLSPKGKAAPPKVSRDAPDRSEAEPAEVDGAAAKASARARLKAEIEDRTEAIEDADDSALAKRMGDAYARRTYAFEDKINPTRPTRYLTKDERQAIDDADDAAAMHENMPTIKAPANDGTRTNPVEIKTAADLKAARDRINHDATPDQKAAGNYEMGHVTWNGLEISLETGKGHERTSHEMGPDGKPKWSVTMPVDYGYIKRSEGADGEGVDVFIGNNPESTDVWIIDQQDAETKAFDEHKVMIGFDTRAEAVKAYKQSFSDGKGWARLKSITQKTLAEFKDLLGVLWQKKPVYKGKASERGFINLGGARRNGPTPAPRREPRATPPPVAGAKTGPLKRLGERYTKIAQKVISDPWNKHVGWRYDALGRLPWKRDYMVKRYLTLGKIGRIDDTINSIYESLRGATPEQAKAVYDFLTTKGASAARIPDELRAAAVGAKKKIDQVGRALVERGLLSQESYDKYAGSYLPRVYLKHVLGDDNMRAMGAGKTPSDMGYLKQRKDIDEETRMLILGEIQDPAFLASQGIGKPMRDIAILDFLAEISENKDWALPASFVEWKGRKVSAVWLKGESKRVAEMAAHIPAGARQNETMAMSRAMAAVADPVLENPGLVPQNYRQVPDTARYGMLRGMWIRKEIYDDLVGSSQMLPRDATRLESILGVGGIGTKINQAWKMGKVALNPPSIARNFMSNALLLQLSGVPMAKIPSRFFEAVTEMKNGGEHWKIAQKYGVNATTFTSAELFTIHRELRDLKAREAGPWQAMHGVAEVVHNIKKATAEGANQTAAFLDTASGFYGWMEAVYKTAMIIHEMKYNGASEIDAAMAAQEAVFDYSLVPPTVKYLRNAPIGAPFVTFAYKAAGKMAKVAVETPWRFAPYVALTWAMTEILEQMYDVDEDDLDSLMLALPKWLEEKGGAYLLPFKDEHGRWQAVDLGYMFPWQMLNDAMGKAGKGDIGGTVAALGLFEGPLADLITALKTNIDPFTSRPIANKADPPAKRVRDTMTYLWRMAAPGWLTDIGLAGHVANSLLGTGQKANGEPVLTPGQVALRAVGINVYPIEPERTRASNIKSMGYEISQTTARRNKATRDRSLSPDQRKRAVKEYNDYLQVLRHRRTEYSKASKIHPNLRTTAPKSTSP